MAEKGLYKKAVDSWGEDVKFAPRAKVNKMFEKNQKKFPDCGKYEISSE